MPNLKPMLPIVFIAGAAMLPTALNAQTDDIFAFIPDGGRSLLASILSEGVPNEKINSVLFGEKDSAGWLESLTENEDFAAMDEFQMQTLAQYLAHNMPLSVDTAPVEFEGIDWGEILPRDGRDLTLEYCQSCHIITVVITQDRLKESWIGTMNKPSHIEIDLTPEERDALADYLIINAGIPIDLVPPALRAGGASY